jgi:hypothetical protein
MDAAGFSTLTHRGRIFAFKASAIDAASVPLDRALMEGKLVNGIFAFPYTRENASD